MNKVNNTFVKWCLPYEKEIKAGYHLDKDIMQSNVDNKIYSPQTCVFVTAEKNLKERNKIKSKN